MCSWWVFVCGFFFWYVFFGGDLFDVVEYEVGGDGIGYYVIVVDVVLVDFVCGCFGENV